jgi:hypothetical protein
VILLELSFIMDKTKRGIALFITLLIIASILSIVAVSFSYLEKAQDDAGETSALIQGNLLYKNTTNILKQLFPKGKVDSKKLDTLYSIPMMLSEEKSEFMINLQCRPLMIGIPISWLDQHFVKKIPERYDLATDVLDYILEKYEIKEPYELKADIFAQITGEREERSDYEPRLTKPVGTLSKEAFDKILFEYRLAYNDINVYKVPWEKYFVFTKVTQSAIIDGEYLSAELLSAAFDIPMDVVKSQWTIDLESQQQKPTLATFVAENGSGETINSKLFSKEGLNALHCEETYAYRGSHYRFSFDYENERNANFEFYGKI